MRSDKRIEPFLKELGEIWKTNCPDWTFGQLMVNVLDSLPVDPSVPEEDKMIEYFKDFFKEDEE